MTKFMKMFSIMGLVAIAAATLPEVASAGAAAGGATDVGSNLFQNVQDLIRGNLGVVIGLLLSLFGLWMWLVQQATWGLIIVIAGAALTAFPGIYGGISQGISQAFGDTFGDPVRGEQRGQSGI